MCGSLRFIIIAECQRSDNYSVRLGAAGNYASHVKLINTLIMTVSFKGSNLKSNESWWAISSCGNVHYHIIGG